VTTLGTHAVTYSNCSIPIRQLRLWKSHLYKVTCGNVEVICNYLKFIFNHKLIIVELILELEMKKQYAAYCARVIKIYSL